MTNKVTLPAVTNVSNGKNFKGDKPLWHSLKLLVLPTALQIKKNSLYFRDDTPKVTELAELCVWGPASRSGSRVYATIWVHANGCHVSGHGTAGGYGYCKASAACGEALRSAGFILERRVDGVGMSAVEDALIEIGIAFGYRRKQLYVVHGA
jgi:hypothetical protein